MKSFKIQLNSFLAFFFLTLFFVCGTSCNNNPNSKNQSKAQLNLLEELKLYEYKQVDDQTYLKGELIDDKLNGFHSFKIEGDKMRITWQVPGYSKVETDYEFFYYTNDTLITDKNFYTFYAKDGKLFCTYESSISPEEMTVADDTVVNFDDMKPIYYDDLEDVQRILFLERVNN